MTAARVLDNPRNWIGVLQLRQLATVKTMARSTRLRPNDIALRRCSGTLQLVGEPVYLAAAP